ncbi:MAG: GAF domain-containing protein, partial [Gemmatimonadetes bacterium]|nr:GAF domain-containing protein [Gemmatimonadota bacterium]
MSRRHRKRAGAGHGLLVALLPILLLYTVVALLRLPLVPDLGFQFRQFAVTDISPGGPADRAGLRPGDEVLRMQGVHRDDMMGILRAFGTFRPGDRILFQVERAGAVEHYEIIAAERSPEDRLRIAIRSLVGLAFAVLGFIVFWNRNDIVASLFYFAGITLGFLLIEPPPTGSILLQFAIKTAADFAILFAAPVILHLFLLFPRKKAIPSALATLGPVTILGRRTPCGLYVVSAFFFLMSLALNVTIYFTGNLHRSLLSFFQFISALYMLICILAGVGAFLHSYRTTKSPVMKRKLRGVAWGTSIALLPFAFTNVYKMIRPEGEIFAGPYFVLLVLLLPLSFGHAIVRYGLLDLEIIVKRSMLYTILTAFLAVAYIGLVDLVGRLVRNVSGGTDILPSILTIFLIALLFSPARDLIQEWIDRTFFREKFRYRRTLHEFSQAITSILDLKTLLRVLVRRISQTLHVNRVAVFLKDDATGNLILQESAGVALEAAGAEPIAFGGDDKIVRFLEGSHRAVPIDRMADGEGTILLPAGEKARLAELESSLLIPLISGDRLTGIVSLGPKESGEVYSREDRELLNTLANQATLAIENAQLHRETIDRERMKQE